MNITLSETAQKNAQEVAAKLGVSTEILLTRALEGLLVVDDGVYPPDEVIAIRAMQDPDCAPIPTEEELKQYKPMLSLEDFIKNETV
jgi:Zn-dependent peptidase ImmA (M78 family)